LGFLRIFSALNVLRTIAIDDVVPVSVLVGY
jgi:hypothetical protein